MTFRVRAQVPKDRRIALAKIRRTKDLIAYTEESWRRLKSLGHDASARKIHGNLLDLVWELEMLESIWKPGQGRKKRAA